MAEDVEKIDELIRQLIPINELPAKIQDEFIDESEILTYEEGDTIFRQGDEDEYSFYLLEGEIELQGNVVDDLIKGDSNRSRYALAKLQPRQFTAQVRKTSTVLRILRTTVDNLIVLYEDEQINSYGRYVNEEGEMDGIDYVIEDKNEDVDWMMKVLQSELFSKIPTANVQTLFAVMKPLSLKAGDIVIKQGDPGEHYFIIQEGQCQVTRSPRPDTKEIKLAVLYSGEGFGEESLLLDTSRNATVSMLTDGVVMQLSKEDFIELIKKPTLQATGYDEAQALVGTGKADWLDVRFKEEHLESSLTGSINIPLNMLRLKAGNLSRDKQYVVYCDTGGRSLSAAFLLTTLGLDVCYLEGGLLKNPQAATVSMPAVETKVDMSKIVRQEDRPQHNRQAEVKNDALPELDIAVQDIKIDDIEAFNMDDLDPEVKLSVLEADLADTNMKLMDTSKIINANCDEKIKATQIELEQKLKQERKNIQAARKKAQREAVQAREFEETRIINMKMEVEKQLQEERKKLEEVYKRNAEEMEKIQSFRRATAEKIKQEKARLEQAASDANRKLREATRIKQEIASSGKDLSGIEPPELQQDEMEQKVQEQVKLMLKQERKKLAEHLVKYQRALEKAKHDKASAEAARKEAVQMVARHKAKYQRDRARIEQQIKQERLKLEQEKTKIQKTLKHIETIKQEAELARKQALEEMKKLKEERKSIEMESTMERNTFIKALQDAEEKMHNANRELAQAQQKQVKVAAARKINDKDLEIQKLHEDDVDQQLQSELTQFTEYLDEKEKLYDGMISHQEHMKKVNKVAKQTREAAKLNDNNLLDEIQSQLANCR